MAQHLELTEAKITAIERDQSNEENRRIKVLEEWRSKKGSNATYLALVECFITMQNRQLAEEVIIFHKAHKYMPSASLADVKVCPEKAYPNWKTLSNEEREKILKELKVAYKNVCDAYSDMMVDVKVLFKKCNVDPEDVKLKLKTYIKGRLTIDDDSQTLSEVPNNIYDIFIYIAEHTSWINYDLLEIVIEKFGNDEAKELLKDYKIKYLIPYIKRPLFEIPNSFITRSTGESIQTSLTIPDDIELTLEEALIIEQKLAMVLEVLAPLGGHDGGSIKLLFHIPKVKYDTASPDTPLRKYVKLDEAIQSYVIDADIITIL